MAAVYVVTYATHSTGYFDALVLSCERHGYKLIVLGFGKPWTGFMQKIRALREFLTAGVSGRRGGRDAGRADDIIIFLDAFDCIALGPVSEFVQKFGSLSAKVGDKVGDKVVFSASRNSTITSLLFGAIKPADRGRAYSRLVSGMYCGTRHRVQGLLDLLCRASDCLDTQSRFDDQGELTRLHKDCERCIALDHDCTLFYNIDWPDGVSSFSGMFDIFRRSDTSHSRIVFPTETSSYALDMATGRVVVKATGQRPLFLHANGDLNIDLVTTALGLPPQQDADRNYAKYSTAYYVSMWKQPALVLFGLLTLAIIALFLWRQSSRASAPRRRAPRLKTLKKP